MTQLSLPIVDCNTWVGFYPRQAIDLTPQSLLALMKRYNVARALFVHTTAVFYDSKTGNDLALKISHESNELILPVATLNPLHYRNVFNEVELRLKQGFRLFRFFPYLQGWKPTIAPFFELAQYLSQHNAPFMMECPQIGWATKITEIAVKLQVPVILTNVNDDNLNEALFVLRNAPNLYLETSCLLQPSVYETIAEEAGSERMVFGSSAPLHYFACALLPLLHSGLPEEDKRNILVENLRRIVRS